MKNQNKLISAIPAATAENRTLVQSAATTMNEFIKEVTKARGLVKGLQYIKDIK